MECNNIETLYRVFEFWYLIFPNYTHFNLTDAIHYMVQVIPFCWKAKYVKGHRNENPFES